ncbi:Hypothetical protein PHPALM_2872, partial [Phytophthora palmivora]
MPLSAEGLALIAQGADVGGMVSGEGMGIQVTRTLFPVKSEPEDIDMLEEEAEVSERSGPAQIELNVMRQQQEWQSRMEQAQLEFLARERLESMERDRRREQRDLEARREFQTLTDRLLESENARLEAERRADDAEERRSLVSEKFADRWRQREAEAEAQHARATDEMKRDWISQMKTLQQRMKDLEAERDREKESSQNMQRFQAGQLRNLRATLSQVQEARGVGHPDLATATPFLVTEDPE